MQVVVITGLAQGMGREVALRLAAAGDAVAGFDVDAASTVFFRSAFAIRFCCGKLTSPDRVRRG